jgi:hypothetical protein
MYAAHFKHCPHLSANRIVHRMEERFMFFHDKRLQYNARPDRPDPYMPRSFRKFSAGSGVRCPS